ncbi:MAG TPA: small ribosomal subunit Rsm22 family protein [Candidatus Kapabacteria bacterium]|nr:small ribosomal subunit Rsm22 family protein [Candidatus Kapabacteria bacterium]
MAISRSVLTTSELYTKTLEEVLGIKLGRDDVKRRETRASLERIAESVTKLNEGLTVGRESFLAQHYLSDPEIRKAYQLYYTTTNYLKIIPPLRELALSDFFDKPSLRILDLGTGTGAAIWGILDFLETEVQHPIDLDITAVDSVAQNIKDIQRFHFQYLKHCTSIKSKLTTRVHDLETPISFEEKFDLIVMMNTLNELSEEAEERLLTTFPTLLSNDGVVLMIEPATRKQSRRLLSFRDAAVKNAWTIYAPCTRQSNCPALENTDNWCHSEYKWERLDFIRIIDEAGATLRLSLKSTYIIMNRHGQTLPNILGKQNLWRSVSERFDEKGRTRAILCGEPARAQFIMNKRDKTVENKDFMKVERYDIIEITADEPREHDRQITGSSQVNLVLPVLGAQ